MKALTLIFLPAMLCNSIATASNDAQPGTTTAPAPGIPAMPQRFLENKGQYPDQVLYRADFGTLALFAERDILTWSMLQTDAGERVHDRPLT